MLAAGRLIVAAEPGWVYGRPLHQVSEIPGVRSIAIIDPVGAAIVWSLVVEPDGAVEGSVDDVLRTIRASDQVAAAYERHDAWTEVILIGPDRCHLIRPFGAAERDGLIVELILDMRTANLAGARQELAYLLEPYRSAPGPSAAEAIPITSGGLARRVPRNLAAPADAPTGPSVGVLNQVLTGLRRLEEG